MAEESSSPFREKSLERLSSPERLDQLLRVVDQRSWLPLITLGGLVLILLIWSIVGRIPINVEGKGVLVRPRRIVEIQSPGNGRLMQVDVQVGSFVEKGDVLAWINRPELTKQLELQQAKAAELRERGLRAEELRLSRTESEESSTRTKGERLSEHIRKSREIANELYQKELASIEIERELVGDQMAVATEMRESWKERLAQTRRLHAQGAISNQALVDFQDDYIDSLARVASLESKERTLTTRELQAEEQYLNRLQRLDDLTFDLDGLTVRQTELAQENLESQRSYEQQLTDVDREIARLESLIDDEGRIVSKYRGRILELNVAVGEVLDPGERVGAMSIEDVEVLLQSVTYFTVKDGKRLESGDPIKVTPDTVERHRVGSIVGKITGLSAQPVTLSEVVNVVGNRELAEMLISGGYLMQVFANLERDEKTYTHYRWTSSKGPETEISAGTTTTARATVDERRPIEFVLPFLKSHAGID